MRYRLLVFSTCTGPPATALSIGVVRRMFRRSDDERGPRDRSGRHAAKPRQARDELLFLRGSPRSEEPQRPHLVTIGTTKRKVNGLSNPPERDRHMGAQWVYRGRQSTATEGLWNRRLLRERGRTARMKASGMAPAGQANRTTLLRCRERRIVDTDAPRHGPEAGK